MLAAVAASGLLLILVRFYCILPGARKKRFSGTASLAVFLGSGGHTAEVVKLLTSVDFERYTPRTYIVSSGDTLSSEKARTLELQKASGSSPQNYDILTIPRARHVHQSLLATPPTALSSLLSCVYHVTLAPLTSARRFADVLILNGPGSCVILCIAVYISKFWGLPAPKLIYVESFARVSRMSLSGRLLRPFVDRFIVQWPELLDDKGRGECRGWLV